MTVPSPVRTRFTRLWALVRDRRALTAGLYAAHLWAIFSIAISNVFLALAVLVAPWRSQATQWPRWRRILIPALLYLWCSGLSVAFSTSPGESRARLGELFAFMTLALAPLAVRDERGLRWVLRGGLALAAGVSLWGLSQYFIGFGDIDNRIRGPFSHWMTFSGVLLLCDSLLLGTVFARGRKTPPLVWLVLALVNAALFGALTRGAWVALGISLLLMAAFTRRRMLLALPLLALLLVLLSPVSIVQRMLSITDLSDESNYDRLCMLDAGLRMVAQHPMIGIGPDMVPLLYPLYRHPTAPRLWVQHLHDTFLQIAAESGLPTLAAYAWLMLAAGRQAWRGLRREGRDGPRADLYLGALVGIFAFAIAGLFENNWGDSEVKRCALFLVALPFCLPESEPEQTPTAP